jgi:hypothetical protein
MISNSVEVELQRVCMCVYCINCVHTVFNSTCTVAGPNTRSKLLTYTEKELKLYSSLALTVCACAEKGSTEIKKNMRKKIRTVIIYSGEVLKRGLYARKNAAAVY